MFEVFWRFFLLGWVAFGGPAAHIGYFQRQFVEQRKWLDQATFNELLAVSQALPGPGSSQLGMAIGYQKAGIAGFFAAFVGFTLPVALILSLVYFGFNALDQLTIVIQGLKLLAVAVVADAIVKMAKPQLNQRIPRTLLIAALLLTLVMSGFYPQYLVIALGAIAGAIWLAPAKSQKQSGRLMMWPIVLAFALLAASFIWPEALFSGFYQVGALVFGGGHVMLPMLQYTPVMSSLTNEQFIAGYGVIQALPGPMFGIAMLYASQIGGWAAGWLALLAIFLPGALLMLAWMPARLKLQQWRRAQGAIAGINAAVVGLLAAVFYQSLWLPIAADVWQVAAAVILFSAIAWWQRPIWQVVPLSLLLASGLAFF
ncbi:chromate efflux transporter [Salinibius halmophilus]|uniref:chromate efflux transporter n=1 Tax=Salinibius halmophilus TaxID=1853216 RepID=UPI000E668057|nr:chromate efflux transporter [Salinibius halmophilus]